MVRENLKIMERKFTLQEIRNYIQKQDSLGDVLYFLNEENINKANEFKEDIFIDDKEDENEIEEYRDREF